MTDRDCYWLWLTCAKDEISWGQEREMYETANTRRVFDSYRIILFTYMKFMTICLLHGLQNTANMQCLFYCLSYILYDF